MMTAEPVTDLQVTLRPGTADDVSSIVEMLRELALYQGQKAIFSANEADFRRDGFGPSPCFECLMAETPHEAVGVAVFHQTYSTWDTSRGLFIQDLFVSEKVRGQGVGHRLVQRIAAIGADRQCTHLQLNVVHANPARNFYDRFGFVHVSDLLTYRLSGKGFDQLVTDAL